MTLIFILVIIGIAGALVWLLWLRKQDTFSGKDLHTNVYDDYVLDRVQPYDADDSFLAGVAAVEIADAVSDYCADNDSSFGDSDFSGGDGDFGGGGASGDW